MENYTVSAGPARRQRSRAEACAINAWVRTRRDSKAGFSFLEVNDGSCLANLQVIADQRLTITKPRSNA